MTEKPLESFEKWWAKEMGECMRGSKYLARKAWLAAWNQRKGKK